MYQVALKLKKVKSELKVWAKNQFGNFHDKITKNEDKIKYVEDKLLAQPNSLRLNSWMFRLLKQREKLLLFNQKYWGKYKRKEWLTKGDRNSKFFQRAVDSRRRKQNVIRIKDDCDLWIDDQKSIAEKFLSDFTLRYKSDHQGHHSLPSLGLPKLITDSENVILTGIPDLQEIKNALFSIDDNKTPGSDGFGAGFFKKNWHIIGLDFTNGIVEFFRHGKMLKEINHTFITLIPKNVIPCRTSHYRPISLCSTMYKTIFKILVNRLRPFLDKLVSPFQSAFIPGRSIHDNILLTHEIMHKFRKCKGKTAWVALKLDMEKAYDRLEWGFIQKCFQELGFHPQWIKWVMECISSVSYSFLINGASHGLLLPSRGIRQGDPLSPYICLLYTSDAADE